MNARVELFDQLAGVFRQPHEQRPWKVVFTDPSGAFSFARVSAMSYRVRVEASGFETVSRTVSNALAPLGVQITQLPISPNFIAKLLSS
jgi:hypothetical protein